MPIPLPLILALAAGGLFATAAVARVVRRAPTQRDRLWAILTPELVQTTADAMAAAAERDRQMSLLQSFGSRFAHLVAPEPGPLVKMRAVFEMFRPLIERGCPPCLVQAATAERDGDVLGMVRALWSAIARAGLGLTSKTTQDPEVIVAAVGMAAELARQLYTVSELVTLARGMINAAPRMAGSGPHPWEAQLASTPRAAQPLADMLARWALERSMPIYGPAIEVQTGSGTGRFYWELFVGERITGEVEKVIQ